MKRKTVSKSEQQNTWKDRKYIVCEGISHKRIPLLVAPLLNCPTCVDARGERLEDIGSVWIRSKNSYSLAGGKVKCLELLNYLSFCGTTSLGGLEKPC